jgi:TPR repeat protein
MRASLRFALAVALALSTAPCAAQFDEEAFFRPGMDAVFAYFAPAKSRCAQGDAASCARVSSRLQWASTSIERDALTQSLRSGCAKGIAVACGGAASWDLETSEDDSAAKRALEKACMDGDGISCARHAARLGRDMPAGSDARANANRIVAESCEKLGGWPCFMRAQVLVQGGLSPSDPKVVAVVERACDGGDGYACFHLGLAASEADAPAYHRKGCGLDYAKSCHNLGWAYKKGEGVPKDEKAGLELSEKGCRLGDSKACDTLATETGKFEHYCTLWGAIACYYVVSAETKNGETAQNADRVVALGMAAAVRGYDVAARMLSHYLKDNERHCNADKSDADACAAAGSGYAAGWDGSRADATTRAEQKKRALLLLDRSCAAGAKNMCAKAAALRTAH